MQRHLALAVALVAIGCGSNAPMPSAGTNATTAPSAGESVPLGTSAVPPTPGPTLAPGQTATPAPAASATAEASPLQTIPPAAAIAAELVSPGSLTVCLSLLGAPAATMGNDGTPVGYNVAFADEIAARLSLNPVIQTTDFSELTTQVTSHACDISVSSQNITAQRTAQMNLIPYTQAKLGFPILVSFGNPKKINSLNDLCGEAVSAAAGTTSVDAVLGQGDYTGRGLSDQCVANKKKAIDLHTYASEAQAVQALLDFGVAAYLGNANFADQYPDLIQKSSASLPAARQGIAVALDHPNLTAGVQAALGAMISDGTYLRILSQYLPADDVANFSIVDQ